MVGLRGEDFGVQVFGVWMLRVLANNLKPRIRNNVVKRQAGRRREIHSPLAGKAP